MLATEFHGMVSSSKMTDFPLWRTMSGLAVVVLSSTGIVAGGDSQARWLGMSAKTAAVGYFFKQTPIFLDRDMHALLLLRHTIKYSFAMKQMWKIEEIVQHRISNNSFCP